MPISSPSEIAREVDRALLLIGGASLLLLAGITIAMVAFAFKYRRDKAKTTSQFTGHVWLEITWVIIPTLIVTWFFFVGYRGFAIMRRPPENAMLVEVEGKQWSWSFFYPEEKVGSSELVVPVDTPVKLLLTAPEDDVIHSFYIPDFRVKEDVLPGRQTSLWFESEREGDFNIFCAEFCGKDHSQMISMLRVVSDDEYEQWVRTTMMKRYRPLEYEALANSRHPGFGELGIATEALYASYCASCHAASGDGSGLPGLARDFTSAQNWKHERDVAGIFRALQEGVAGTQMRSFPNLSAWEKVALAHKVRSFMPGAPPETTREEYEALIQEYELDKVQGPRESIPVEQAIDALLEESQNGGQSR